MLLKLVEGGGCGGRISSSRLLKCSEILLSAILWEEGCQMFISLKSNPK
jgi:hypothetical protein